MCFYYDGHSEFESRSYPRSRKEYACCECREVIPKGAVHEYAAWKFDGSFETSRTCRRCVYLSTRIHEMEVAAGCHWSESWCPKFALDEYIGEYGLSFETPVPDEFDIQGKTVVAESEATHD